MKQNSLRGIFAICTKCPVGLQTHRNLPVNLKINWAHKQGWIAARHGKLRKTRDIS